MRLRRTGTIILVGIACTFDLAVAQQGPKSGSGETVARPRNKKGDTPQMADEPRVDAPGDSGKIPTKFGKNKDRADLPEGLATFRTDTTTISVDVSVLDNKGRFIPNIPRGNFRILEDGVPQQASTFAMGEAPMTVCMVIEFSNLFQSYWSYGWMETLQASYGFLETLKPDDHVAVVAYDLRSEILSDFSTDKRSAHEAMSRLRIAAYSESNLYDALVDTAERMQDIEGRKAIVLIASGIDTFSRINFGDARKVVQEAGIPIYIISTGNLFYKRFEGQLGATDSISGMPGRLTFLQAKNQMNTFARESGGMHFEMTFESEIPAYLQSINALLRSQYSIAYDLAEKHEPGKKYKLEVKVDVDGDGTFDDKQFTVQHRPFVMTAKPKEPKSKKS